jgi:L-fuconolactonase
VIIDAHAHVFRPTNISPRGTDVIAPPDRDAPVSALLSIMDENGVDAAVLAPLDTHDDYVAESLAAHPDRFTALAVASPTETVSSLRERRARFPYRAVRASWLGDPGELIDNSPFLPVLRHLAEEGLPLWSYLPPDQLPLLRQAVNAIPELVVVLNHLGFTPRDMRADENLRPWFVAPFPPGVLDTLSTLADAPNVHLMFSGQYALSRAEPPYPDLADIVTDLTDRFGPQRTLWGSDFPWPAVVPGYRALLDLPATVFSAADLEHVLGGTAAKLFPGLGAAQGPSGVVRPATPRSGVAGEAPAHPWPQGPNAARR